MSEPSGLFCPLPDPEQALAELLSAGLRQLRQKDPAGAELLEPWAEPLLTRMAWQLVQDGLSPEHKLPSSESFVETELAVQSNPGARQDPAGRRKLMFLLERGDRLMEQAHWLVDSSWIPQGILRFSSWLLPNLLVGKRLGQDRALAAQWRDPLGARPDWALAAWAAVRGGDPVGPWVEPLFTETDPVRLFGRLVPAACALAAVDPAALLSDERLRSAYALCASGLALFPPRCEGSFGTEKAPQDAWQLPRVPWQQAVLALAGWPGEARRQLAELAPDPLRPHPRLAPLLRVLAREQPGAVLPRHIAALLRPEQALEQGWMDHGFWRSLNVWGEPGVGNLLMTVQSGVYPIAYNLWMEQVLLPLLAGQADAGSVEAQERLALPGRGGPAYFLMNRPERYPLWERAWLALAGEGSSGASAAELGAAWVEAASRQIDNSDSAEGQSAQRGVLDRPVARLRERGDWPQAHELLRQKLFERPPSGRKPSMEYKLRLLRLAELSEEDWTRLLARVHPDLENDLLYRDAGAPPALLAQRAVSLLTTFAQGDRAYQARLGAAVREALSGDPKTVITILSAAEPQDSFGGELLRWPEGPWLVTLLELREVEAQPLRQKWLRHLALRSEEAAVRSRAVRALMDEAGGTS